MKMADMELDVEKGSVEDSTTSSSLTPEDEKPPGYFQKAETAVKEENLNVPGSEDDSKVIQKMDVEASRVRSEIEDDIARVASRAVMAAVSLVSGDTPKRSNLERAAQSSELVERSHGEGPSEAAGSSGPRDSVTECQLAARIARTAAVNAREEVAACRRLIGLIDEAIDVIQRQVDDFVEKAENDETGNYMDLVEKHRSSIRTLRRKARKLEAAANSAEEASINADQNALFAAEVTDEELDTSKRAKFMACYSKNAADAACIVAHRVEHSALRSMKRIWSEIRDGGNVSEDSSNNELSQQCHNRGRKTKIAHVVSLVIGIAFLAALALFEPRSKSFEAILCLGLLTVGWSLVFWAYELYKCVKSRSQEDSDAISETARLGFLDHLEERLDYLQAYLQRNNTSPAPSDSETDS